MPKRKSVAKKTEGTVENKKDKTVVKKKKVQNEVEKDIVEKNMVKKNMVEKNIVESNISTTEKKGMVETNKEGEKDKVIVEESLKKMVEKGKLVLPKNLDGEDCQFCFPYMVTRNHHFSEQYVLSSLITLLLIYLKGAVLLQ